MSMSIIAHHSVMLSGQAVATHAPFDPAARASTVTLSNGDMTAAANAASAGFVLSTSAKTTGKFYVEFVLDVRGSSDQAVVGGIATGVQSNLATYFGVTASQFGSCVEGSAGSQRNARTNNVRSGIISPGSVLNGDRMCLALDATLGRLWLGYWTSRAWIGGGDPAANTSPTFTFAAGSSCRFAVNPWGLTSRISIVPPAGWAGVAPTGFGVWTP